MRLFIVGTGTDVGKTHVSACLLAHARGRGVRARAYKPVASGVVGLCEDAERHADAAGEPYVPPTFAFERPVSPHLAAREEGRRIDLELVRTRADELHEGADLVLVESAGGLFTPLGDDQTNLDLALRLQPALTVLVAPDQLGVLSDVAAYRLAARALGVDPLLLVLSAPSAPDASTGTNGDELDALGLGPTLGVFPRADVHDGSSQAVAAEVWRALERCAMARGA